jgi:D-lactate dehydrogenase (cytochrome)
MAQFHPQTIAAMARSPMRMRFAAPQHRVGLAFVRFYAKDLQTEGPKQPQQQKGSSKSNNTRVERSFASDVQGSIQSRIRRENQRREQYERWRQLTDPSRNWTVTFSRLTRQ